MQLARDAEKSKAPSTIAMECTLMGVIREPGSFMRRLVYAANGTWYSEDVAGDEPLEIGSKAVVRLNALTLARPKDVKRVTEKPAVSTDNTPVSYKGVVRKGRKNNVALVSFAGRYFTVRLAMADTPPAIGGLLRVDRRFLKPAAPADLHRANRGLSNA